MQQLTTPIRHLLLFACTNACVSVVVRGAWRGSFSGSVFQVVDKSEYRTYAAQSLVQLLNKLPCAEYASFMAWLYGLTPVSRLISAYQPLD